MINPMITMTCNLCGAGITGTALEVIRWDTEHRKECEKTK